MPDAGSATREVFGNIAPWMRVAFYLLVFTALAWSARDLWRRALGWRKGLPGEWERDPKVWGQRFLTEILGQKRVRQRSPGGKLHLLLFSGFAVLTLGTTLLFIAEWGPFHFHRGAYYLAYEAVMDLFGGVYLAGCGWALHRRAVTRPRSLGHTDVDFALLALLLGIGITGFLLEALRLTWDGSRPEVAAWSVVGSGLSRLLAPALPGSVARTAHLTVWWTHVAMIVGLFALFPRTRMLHVVTGTLNVLLRPSRPAGALRSVSLEAVEETGRIGISDTAHFTDQERLSLDACMECGRCQDACPAFATGKPLSPKALVQDLRAAVAREAGPLHGPVVQAETLWACTQCQACVFECPVRIRHVDLIADMRRHLVAEGQLAGPPAQSLRRIGTQGNPLGQPAGERLAWAEGLDVQSVEQNPGFEVLLWVGCAASYDPRARKVARATAQLLQRAGVNFAVLGRKERCTGDPARRLGEEFLFQQMAQENAATLVTATAAPDPPPELGGQGGAPRARRIVTPCPHCLNTLRNEYGEFGAALDVVHHSQYLAELLASGRLPSHTPTHPHTHTPTLTRAPAHPRTRAAVTLHDPCYLARVNGETGAPRALLHAAGLQVLEMPRHGERTFCCGAGGGRFWFEERPEQRVNRLRAAEAAGTGAATLATACPFCLNMMTDGVAGTPGSENLRVADISELLLESLEEPSGV